MSSATGRLSPHEPVMRNIPVHTKLADTIRHCFVQQPDRACRRCRTRISAGYFCSPRCARADDKICSDGDLRCKHCRRHAIAIAYYSGVSGPCCQRHYRKSFKWTVGRAR